MQTPVIEIRENEYLIKLNRNQFDLGYLRKVLKSLGLEQSVEKSDIRERTDFNDELGRYYDRLSDK